MINQVIEELKIYLLLLMGSKLGPSASRIGNRVLRGAFGPEGGQ